MNQFKIENHGTDTYLVYPIAAHEEIDSYCRGMLENNDINGIAPVLFTQNDAHRFIKYNITGMVSVKKYFSTGVTKKKLLAVFSSIVNTLILANEYMIDTSSFILDINYIYVDIASNKIYLLCLPIEKPEVTSTDLLPFFKNIMFNTQFESSESAENYEYVARLVTYLNNTSAFSLQKFKELIDSLIKNETISVKKAVANSDHISSDSISIMHSGNFKTVTDKKTDIPNEKPNKEKLVGKIPEKGIPKKTVVAEEPQTDANEDKISLFFLLQHYNKENVAKYKAQKNAAKNKKATKKNTPEKKKSKSTDFLIPGKDSDISEKIESIPEKQDTSVKATHETDAKHQNGIHTQDMDFGDTIVMQYSSIATETVALNSDYIDSESQPIPYLVREKNNQKVTINKNRFIIGTDETLVDYCINDNNAVSHNHAEIVTINDEYYIIDKKSTNHTFVNGKIIRSGSEVLLKSGDSIRLANERFEFFIL